MCVPRLKVKTARFTVFGEKARVRGGVPTPVALNEGL